MNSDVMSKDKLSKNIQKALGPVLGGDITPFNIHYWMEMGIIPVDEIKGNRRLYSETIALERIFWMKKLQDQYGKTIREIVDLIPYYFDPKTIKRSVEKLASRYEVCPLGDAAVVEFENKKLIADPDHIIDNLIIWSIEPEVDSAYLQTFPKTALFYRQLKGIFGDRPPIITRAIVNCVLIPMPTFEKQIDIMSKVKGIFREISELEQKIVATNERTFDIFDAYLNQGERRL